MRVTVMTPSRTKMLLDEVETLRDVKLQIMTNTGIPARQQLVYFKGRQLKVGSCIFSCINMTDISSELQS